MHPDDRDLDDEIRGHLAIDIHDRMARGESPEQARLNALRQFGYVARAREEMRRVWYSRWYDATEALWQDIRVGMRSLLRSKGMSATVVVTLALGIGANAAIFSVVRGVLLRPLVNRGEDRLIYIGQGTTGAGVDDTSFSVPEIKDFRAGATTVAAFGEFSTVDFTLIGLGEPRVVHAGVVNGDFFDVMGLRPRLGRLITPSDDGRNASGVAVLTHRFWVESLASDPSVVGKVVRLDKGNATIIGVLEPSVPYPQDTEIIANMVTSPHHLGASMESVRTHRMTQLFGRLQPGVTIDEARAQLETIHASMVRDNPDAYTRATTPLQTRRLRDQIASPARSILLLLLAAAGVVFVIACSNIANLILARSVRREGELMIRAAVGASRAALRRTLLAESLVLCGGGAVLGLVLAGPLVSVVARFAARFSARALEVTVDPTLLWVSAGLAMVAAVLLAYVPRLPDGTTSGLAGVSTAGIRITPATNRRLKIFATTQIAFTFVMLASAVTLLAPILALQTAATGYDNMRQVLAIDLPAPSLGFAKPEELTFYDELMRRIDEVPGVDGVAMAMTAPWRDRGLATPKFSVDGFTPANGEELPRARFRVVSPGFLGVIGMRILAGRDLTADDRRGGELVAVVSKSFADRMFPNGEALNHHMWWVDPIFGPKPAPRRIVGIVADVDDENIAPGGAMAVYHPTMQIGVIGNRMFVHASGDPYALVQPITKLVRGMAPNQPVERPATLQDIRAEVLAPERLNALVLSGFAGVALLIAIVGVSGVLAFGVSARTREFGVRLAIGSSPSALLRGVLSEGLLIVVLGVTAGGAFGYIFTTIAASYFHGLQVPSSASMAGAALVVISAALAASLMPAARASRVDVLQALRSE